MSTPMVKAAILGGFVLCLAACAGGNPPVDEPFPQEKVDAPANPVIVSTFDEAVQRADASWKAGELDRALMYYVQAASLDKSSELPLLRMASIHEQRKEPALAFQAFEQALKRAPGNAAAHERFGFLLLRDGNSVDRAGTEFAEALKLEPTRWRAQMGLGLVAHKRRDLAAARAHFDAALARRPDQAELLTYSAELSMQTGDLERGLREARRALEIADVAATRTLLGDMLARSGDYTGGLEAYLETMDESRAYLRLGEEAMRARDYERAVRYFDRSMETSPTFNDVAAKRLAVARERLVDATSTPRRAVAPPVEPRRQVAGAPST